MDAARPNGHAVALIEASLHKFGEAVEEDPAIRAGVERGTAAIVAGLLPLAQERAADFVADVVSHWDARTVVTDRLELRVGRGSAIHPGQRNARRLSRRRAAVPVAPGDLRSRRALTMAGRTTHRGGGPGCM